MKKPKGEIFATVVGAIIYALAGIVFIATLIFSGNFGSAIIYALVGFIFGSLFISLSHIIHNMGGRED